MTTSYLPPISWWHKWIEEGMPPLDDNVPFCKRHGLNRCCIDSPNGQLTLTVPVSRPGTTDTDSRLKVSDLLVSEHGDWRHKHWHALESTYFNSPFFEYYQDDFRPVFEQQFEHFTDLNTALINVCADLLDTKQLQALLPHHRPMYGKNYYQVFAHKHGFLPDLSIFDLLMNMGPESVLYL